MNRSRALPLVLLLSFAAAAHAQQAKDTPKPGDEMIYKYLCAETDKLSQKFLDGATTLEEWQKKRPRLYQEYMDMLGLWPMPEKMPLRATVTGQVEAHGVIVEKLHYQSKPGLYVTANLYRPKTPPTPPSQGGENNDSPPCQGGAGGGKKLPAILYLCGHSNKGRDGSKSAFQDHGFWFANNGYVCLVLDTLQLGEIPGVHHGTYGRPWNHLGAYGQKDKNQPETRWWWHSLGYTPAGVEAWNGVRGIDYLLTRPDVDPERIGVTGISGGGAATFWVACADDRVKVAVPVSGMSDLESYVKNKVVNGHCDCMFLYNTYQWDWTTIAALIAPRPMLFANSDDDKIFPMDGNRRIMEKLRKLYAMYGKGELVDEYVSKGGHAYRPDLRVAIFKFLNKHLKNDATTAVEDSEKYKPLEGKELRVFPTDADVPKDAINARIDETFVAKAKVALSTKRKFAEWKTALIGELREKVFRAFPMTIPVAKKPLGELPIPLIGTEPNIGVLFDEGTGDLVVILDKADSPREKDAKNPVLAPRAFPGYWTIKSPPNYVERSHVLLGRTIDLGSVWDTCAIARSLDDKEVHIRGRGQAGILAAYAALFEPSIKEVIIIDPPKSHIEGPHFLNVLRVLDIPEALGLLAPNVKLTLIGGGDPAFDRTAEIYRLAGAADKFVRK